jgi:ABC-type branched-subunit amino acid transport system substrate-binding protein
MARRPLLLLVCAAVAPFFAACERQRDVFALPEAESDGEETGVIGIGAFGTLTGDGAQTGRNVERGFALAIELANAKGGVRGRLVDVVWYDDQGRLEGARAAGERLSRTDKAVVILSAADDARTNAAREAAGVVPIVCATCAGGAASETVFALGVARDPKVASATGQSFAAAWRERYPREEPDESATRGFDAGKFVLEGLARAKTYRPEDVRAALASIREQRH